MNKQDRQNKTILKGERDSSCLPAPCSPFANVTRGEFYAVQRAGAGQAVMHHTSWAQERSKGTPRARGKQTSGFESSLSWTQDIYVFWAELGVR